MTDANETSGTDVVVRTDSQLKHFVTEIRSASAQIGDHIIGALQDPQTVAVLTTIVIGPDGGQRIVTAGLGPDRVAEIQALLREAAEQRTEEIPCIGFHCHIRPKDAAPPPDDAPS